MPHNSPSGAERAATYRRVAQAADTDRPQPIMTFAVGGSVLKLTGAKHPRGPRPAVKRGKVTSFSKQSRGRLLELVASINKPALRALPIFLTLTYPGVFPTEGPVVKSHLDTFLKRLRRAFPQSACIWKLEFQARGAPHFHLLLFGVPFINRYWLSKAWFEVVGSGDTRHLQAGTRVEFIRSYKGVIFYAAKYVAKVDVGTSADGCGRFWGVMGREFLPVEVIECALSFRAFFRARRVVERYMASKARANRLTRAKKKEVGSTNRKGYVPRFSFEMQGVKVFADSAVLAQLVRCFT